MYLSFPLSSGRHVHVSIDTVFVQGKGSVMPMTKSRSCRSFLSPILWLQRYARQVYPRHPKSKLRSLTPSRIVKVCRNHIPTASSCESHVYLNQAQYPIQYHSSAIALPVNFSKLSGSKTVTRDFEQAMKGRTHRYLEGFMWGVGLSCEVSCNEHPRFVADLVL